MNVKIKELKFVDYSDVDFDWQLCDDIVEDGTGSSVNGRYLEVGFWKYIFKEYIEEGWARNRKDDIEKMLNNIKDLDDDINIAF